MSSRTHLAALVGYSLLAAGLAVALSGAGATLGVQLAGAVIAAGLLAQGAVLWMERERGRSAQIEGLVAGMAALREQLADLANGPGELRSVRGGEIGEVVAEVRVLQRLIEEVSAHIGVARAQPVAAVASAGGAPRPAAVVGAEPDEATLMALVSDGLRDNRVDLFVQPIVSLPQRKRRHFECFSRIRGPGGTLLTPEQFLPAAERSGLISAIDNLLLVRSVQLVRRAQKRAQNVGLFVNISGRTLADGPFFRDFVAFMADNRDLAPHLVFEFAQAHVAQHGEPVLLELRRLSRLGFRFSMDQVTDLAIDPDDLGQRHFRFVKIDAQRLLRAVHGPERSLDMRAFKAELDRNGIDLIVERIETEPTLVELLDLNIDYGQGFLFGEPRPAKEG